MLKRFISSIVSFFAIIAFLSALSSCNHIIGQARRYEIAPNTIAYKKYLIRYDRKVIKRNMVLYYSGRDIVFCVKGNDISFNTELNIR